MVPRCMKAHLWRLPRLPSSESMSGTTLRVVWSSENWQKVPEFVFLINRKPTILYHVYSRAQCNGR
jgi:hypothetical protein